MNKMQLGISVVGRSVFGSSKHTLPQWGIIVDQKRSAIMNPTRWADVTIDKEELEKPLPEDDARRFLKIKPLPTDQAPFFWKDDVIRKFQNIIMKDGRRDLAQRLLCNSFEIMKRIQLKKYNAAKTEEERKLIELDPAKIFKEALHNCTPLLKLTPVKRGGITYQVHLGRLIRDHHVAQLAKAKWTLNPKVPTEVRDREAQFMAMKWIRELCRVKDRQTHMDVSLASEFLSAYNMEGKVVQKKRDIHKQCEANRAYAHYRWS